VPQRSRLVVVVLFAATCAAPQPASQPAPDATPAPPEAGAPSPRAEGPPPPPSDEMRADYIGDLKIRVPVPRLERQSKHGVPGMYMGGVATADFDEDGRADVVMAGYFEKRVFDHQHICVPGLEVRVYLSRSAKGGPIRFERKLRLKNVGVCASQVVTGDFDGDGHADFAFEVREGWDTSAYFGDGKGGFARTTLEKNFGNHSMSMGIAAADIDNDGRDDLIFNSDGEAAHYKAGWALWYKWSNEKKRWRKMQTDFPHRITYGGTIAAGDLDGDGYPEIAVGGNASTPFGKYYCKNLLYGHVHDNVKGRIQQEHMITIPNFALKTFGRASVKEAPNPKRLDDTCFGGDNVQYVIADVDRDGHNDIVSAGSGGFLGVREQPGNAHYSFAILRNVDGTGKNFVTWENVGMGPDGKAGHMMGDSTNTGVGNIDFQSIAVGDLNGDGYPEIFIQGHRRNWEKNPGGYRFDTLFFVNQADGTWVWRDDVLGLPVDFAQGGAVIADFDGDDRNDFFATGAQKPFHSNGNNPADRNTPESVETFVYRGLPPGPPERP
jgi:hypothetical protein